MPLSRILLLLTPLALAACISFGSSRPARETTVVVPSGSPPPTIVCSSGAPPPCN